ncbi:septum formation family protein [Mycolicibacterium sp.]|uniref:septum formation family protein n=1 Tax=Mycolicibacterium sp. TaxID=2320850 RepID=UPI0025F1DC08|nr:septum formation family protein [Mycolicibacterium sp.]
MDPMLELSERDETVGSGDGTDEVPDAGRRGALRALHATSTRRVLLLTALGGLLIAGVVTALPFNATGMLRGATDGGGLGVNPTFANAKPGDCLTWPDNSADAATIVDCKDDHRFEVAESVDMRAYPGSEFAPDAAPPTPARIQQISLEQCAPAVENYLGAKFDPNSRFSISLLWAGDKAWKHSGERRMLCGLQLPGPNNQQAIFKGKVADLDQSKIWPAGTCLGIEPSTSQPTDVPVDCAVPHAMEVTGTVNLAEKFPGGVPVEADQDAFIKDVCNRLTDAYLAPAQLRDTTLTLIYSTVSLPSWNAGSKQVGCSIGATLGNGGWATLINSAKGPLLINGQPPIPPPAIPEGRLNLPLPPAVPGFAPSGVSVPRSPAQPQSQAAPQSQQQEAQHLPAAPAAPPTPGEGAAVLGEEPVPGPVVPQTIPAPA